MSRDRFDTGTGSAPLNATFGTLSIIPLRLPCSVPSGLYLSLKLWRSNPHCDLISRSRRLLIFFFAHLEIVAPYAGLASTPCHNVCFLLSDPERPKKQAHLPVWNTSSEV